MNVLSRAVLPSTAAQELLTQNKIGTKAYQTFITERLHGDTSVWAPMKKVNLETFKCHNKSMKTKVGEKIVQLKEEKNMMSRFLIAARKRPELELEMSIGNYEFSVVPKSLFSVDGKPLPCTDKSKLMHHIEDLAPGTSTKIGSVQQNSVIIIDGMAVVNEITKDKTMQTCQVWYIFY